MGATITIDGIEVGKTPLMKPDVLVGKRLISISKDGYRRATAVVDVAEGKMSEYSPTLTVATEQTRPTEQSISAVESRQNTTQRQPRQSTTQQTTKSSSASKVRNTKTTTLNSSMIQVGTGVEYGLNAQSMLTTIPVELRLGLYNHLFNAFVSAEYNMRNSAFTESDNSSPFLPTIKATQWSFGAKLRLNLLRNMGKSGTTYFAEAGAKYNINTSATFTTGTIDYSTSSYNDGIESSTCYKGDLFNKGSLTGRLAIGCGAKMMEVAIFTSFDLTPTFKLDNLSYYVVDHQYNSPAVTLMDIPEVVQMFKSKAYVGITCKIFFGANSLKR